MGKSRLLIPGLLMLFIACGSAGSDKKNILSEDKMAAILTDMQLAESASRLQLMPGEYLDDPLKWYVEIMQEHGTDTTIFSKSLDYYTSHPDKLEKIYKKVDENLLKQSGVSPPGTEEIKPQ